MTIKQSATENADIVSLKLVSKINLGNVKVILACFKKTQM